MIKILFFFFLQPLQMEANLDQLKECPDKPNCVSTQTENAEKKMMPLPFTGTQQQAIDQIKNIVEKMDRTQLISENDNHLHFTFKSRIFGFVDDVEFLIDGPSQQIHFRSASRTGYSDMGANKKRMTGITKSFLEHSNSSAVKK